MLSSLTVENYRGFSRFGLDGLARVNLLVGKNNRGKTTLLEAAHFLTSGGALDVLLRTAVRRGGSFRLTSRAANASRSPSSRTSSTVTTGSRWRSSRSMAGRTSRR